MEFKIKHQQEEVKIKAEKGEYSINDNSVSSLFKWIKKDEYAVLHYKNQSFKIALVKLDSENKQVKLRVNGQLMDFQISDPMDQLLKNLGMDKLLNKTVSEIKSPMPGLVLTIMCEPGQSVRKGDPLLVLEAMKMENVIKSPVDATIKSIEVAEKTAIEKNTVMIKFE